MAGLVRGGPQPEREHELAPAGGQVDLARQRHVPIFGPVVFLRQLLVP